MLDTQHLDMDDPLQHFGPQTYKIFKLSPSLTFVHVSMWTQNAKDFKFSCFVVTYVILSY